MYILSTAVPPALINGSGTPITGITARTIPIFIRQCANIIPNTPTQIFLPRLSFAIRLSATIFRQIYVSTATSATEPINPQV